MRAVPRDYYATKLTCKAQGTVLIDPVEKEVTVQLHRKYLVKYDPLYILHQTSLIPARQTDLNNLFDFSYVFYVRTVKPLKVKIVSSNEILTAGVKSPLRCEAWGSAPSGSFVFFTTTI